MLPVLFVTAFVDMVGLTMILPLIPFYATNLGAKPPGLGPVFRPLGPPAHGPRSSSPNVLRGFARGVSAGGGELQWTGSVLAFRSGWREAWFC